MSMFILALILGRLNLSMLVNWKKQKGAFVSLTCLQLADQGKEALAEKKGRMAQDSSLMFFQVQFLPWGLFVKDLSPFHLRSAVC